jgi:hypothetical protein
VSGAREVEFLGHVVSAAGIRPLPARIAAIQAHPPLANIKQLQGFLGLFNFYRRFVKDGAAIIKPLTDALKGSKSGTAAVSWSLPLQAAFKAAKDALANLCYLEHPAAAAELSIATDASATHIGGVWQQRRPGGHWQPLGFFSAKLDNAQQRYSTFDRELLAVFSTIRHFRCMLEGRQFTIFTYHRPLIGALSRVSEPRTARQQPHLSYISEFSSDIQHVAGEANTVADSLSRPAQPAALITAATAAATPPPVDLNQLAVAARGGGSRRLCPRWRYSCLAQPVVTAAQASWWTLPQACCGPWCQYSIRVQCLTPYTSWHILGYVHAGSSPAGLCGPPWPPMSPCGAGNASSVPGRR